MSSSSVVAPRITAKGYGAASNLSSEKRPLLSKFRFVSVSNFMALLDFLTFTKAVLASVNIDVKQIE